MSLSEVEYSRMRPQPVQVRLQVWSGSNCNTSGNFFTPLSLLRMMCLAILADNASGNLMPVLLLDFVQRRERPHPCDFAEQAWLFEELFQRS